MIVYCLSIDANAVNMYIIMCVGLYAYKLVSASEKKYVYYIIVYGTQSFEKNIRV